MTTTITPRQHPLLAWTDEVQHLLNKFEKFCQRHARVTKYWSTSAMHWRDMCQVHAWSPSRALSSRIYFHRFPANLVWSLTRSSTTTTLCQLWSNATAPIDQRHAVVLFWAAAQCPDMIDPGFLWWCVWPRLWVTPFDAQLAQLLYDTWSSVEQTWNWSTPFQQTFPSLQKQWCQALAMSAVQQPHHAQWLRWFQSKSSWTLAAATTP